MKKYRDRDFREALRHISTQELDAILQEELRTVPVDRGSVKIILGELKEREKNSPVKNGAESGKAWIRYLSKLRNDERSERGNSNRLVKGMAAALLIVFLLAWLPQEAAAKGFFERISRWTNEFLELFSPDEVNENQYEYVFVTDNPGLQQVHDAVVEMGVTGPAVPMWLPDGYELVELKKYSARANTSLYVRFANGEQETVWQLDIYSDNTTRKIYKSEKSVAEYEFMGTLFQIVNNEESKLICWSQKNYELFFLVDYPEEVIYQIIHSIFIAEEYHHEKNLETSLFSFGYFAARCAACNCG